MEISESREPEIKEPTVLGNFSPAAHSSEIPAVALLPEAASWIIENALKRFLEEVRSERLGEIDRISDHVELSLTELLQRTDDAIGRAAAKVEQKVTGTEGRLAQAEQRHSELLTRRERRRKELEQQRSLSL